MPLISFSLAPFSPFSCTRVFACMTRSISKIIINHVIKSQPVNLIFVFVFCGYGVGVFPRNAFLALFNFSNSALSNDVRLLSSLFITNGRRTLAKNRCPSWEVDSIQWPISIVRPSPLSRLSQLTMMSRISDRREITTKQESRTIVPVLIYSVSDCFSIPRYTTQWPKWLMLDPLLHSLCITCWHWRRQRATRDKGKWRELDENWAVPMQSGPRLAAKWFTSWMWNLRGSITTTFIVWPLESSVHDIQLIPN